MNKIKLDLDGLAVETFPTLDDAPRSVGTVHAFDSERYTMCMYTCEFDPECGGATQGAVTGCTCYCTGVEHPSCDVTCTPSAGEPTCQSGDIHC